MSNPPSNSNGPKRLPTHRQSRDLTLGAFNNTSGQQLPLFQPKRTFAPNLNAKKKTAEPSPSSEASDKLKQPGKDNKSQSKSFSANQKERKERQPRAQYVQSYSMFAQGAGAVTNASAVGISNRPSTGSHISSTGDRDQKESSTTSTLTASPHVVFKKEAKYELDKDCFIADLKSGLYPPLRLPFESPVKSESKPSVTSAGDLPPSSQPQFHNPTTADFLFGSSAEGRLFSLQLPKVLPSPAAVTYASQLHQNAAPSTSTTESGSEPSNVKPEMDLSSFPEGKIGKLQLLRNGKVRLLIGECSFDVDYGFSHPHLIDLAMFSPPPPNCDQFGELSVLGHINHKVIVRPRIEDLIKAKHSQGLNSRVSDDPGDDKEDSEMETSIHQKGLDSSSESVNLS